MDDDFAATNRDTIEKSEKVLQWKDIRCGKEVIEEHDPPRTLQ